MKKYRLLIPFILFLTIAGAQEHRATIVGKLDFLNNGDTILLDLPHYGAFFSNTDLVSTYRTKVVNNSFMLSVPVDDHPEFMGLYLSPRPDKNMSYLIVEPGDSIVITRVHGKYYFCGRGSVKYNLVHKLREMYSRMYRSYPHDPGHIRQQNENLDSIAIAGLSCLDSCKSQLTDMTYRLIRYGILAIPMYSRIPFEPQKMAAYRLSLASYHQDSSLAREIRKTLADTSADLVWSNGFIRAIVNRYKVDSCYLKGKNFSVTDCYLYLKSNFKGKNRDAIVTWMLWEWRTSSENLLPLINDALSYVSEPDFNGVLTKMLSAEMKGAIAFNFSLVDTTGKIRRFDEFRGKVILLDFWFTGCSACRSLAPVLAKVEQQFLGKGVVFLSISIDKYKKQWLSSVKAHLYSSDLALNLYTGGDGERSPVTDHYNINAFPGLILIGKDGKLMDSIVDPKTDNGSSLAEMIQKAL